MCCTCRQMVDSTRLAGDPLLAANYVATDAEAFQAIFHPGEFMGRRGDDWSVMMEGMQASAEVRGG